MRLILNRKLICLAVQGVAIVFFWTIAPLTRKTKVPPFIRQPVVPVMTDQFYAIDRDAQLGPKVVNVKGRANALRFAIPAFVPTSVREPLFEQAPTTVLLM